MSTIFWRTLRNKRVAIIAYSLSGLAMLILYTALYPSLQSQTANLNEVMKSIPVGLLKAFGIEDLTSNTLESLLVSKQYSLIWPLMMVFFASSFAGAAFAGEMESGVIGLVLAAPVSRLRIFWAKYLAGWYALIVFTLVSALSIPLVARLFGITVAYSPVMALTLAGLLFGGAVYALATLASVVWSEKSQGYVVLVSLLVAMYIANLVAELQSRLSWLKYGSFFHYFNATQALMHAHLSGQAVAVFGGVIAAATLLAAMIFTRRDIVV